MEKEIMVSIICNAYNHEDYIRDALESFLMQKTNFAFEVLIHDDASTDNTANIIREYEKKYPDIIKPIYQKENKYSQNIDICLEYQISRAKGKYLAWCEGDDYWIDEYKLQKQFDALESHPNIDICTHAANLVNSETKEIITLISPKNRTTVINVKEVIMWKCPLVYVATNSVFIRKLVFEYKYSFLETCFFDQTLEIAGSLKNGMLFLEEVMSEYRYMSKGSFTSRYISDENLRNSNYDKVLLFLNLLNEDTCYKYSKIIKYVKNAVMISKMNKTIGKDFYYQKEFRDIYLILLKNRLYFSFKERMKIYIKGQVLYWKQIISKVKK